MPVLGHNSYFVRIQYTFTRFLEATGNHHLIDGSLSNRLCCICAGFWSSELDVYCLLYFYVRVDINLTLGKDKDLCCRIIGVSKCSVECAIVPCDGLGIPMGSSDRFADSDRWIPFSKLNGSSFRFQPNIIKMLRVTFPFTSRTYYEAYQHKAPIVYSFWPRLWFRWYNNRFSKEDWTYWSEGT